MHYNTSYTKIVTDENLMETIQHGSKDYPFCFYYDNLSLFDFNCIDWHWHSELEFVLVEKGTMNCSVGEDQFILPEGNAIFINSKVLHRYQCRGQGTIPNFVCLPTMIAPEESLIFNRYIEPILTSSLNYQIFSPNIPWQKSSIQIMQDIITAQNSIAAKELITSSLLLKLWAILYEHTEIIPSEQQTKHSAMLQLMMQYIHSNYPFSISLDDIARCASISKSSALSLFHKYLHTTPVQYLIGYRLKEASRLLSATEYSISAIAQKTGFENVGYFCRKFKENYGFTPTGYRNRKSAGEFMQKESI